MLNFSRRDRPADPKDAGKSPLKPALYEPPGSMTKTAPGAGAAARYSPSHAVPGREAMQIPLREDATTPGASSDGAGHAATTAPVAPLAAPLPADAPGSKLFVGINIKLKGVEISDCDVLVIEGRVEATVHSKTMEIARPGTLVGTALIDVAEIHGEFSGELTARTRLIVHATGRVRGTVRYGKLVVAEGGEVNGDVQRLESADAQPKSASAPAAETRKVAEASPAAPLGSLLGPQR
jgi:cytoskeletal protein CcmA (bactofilin family)